MIKESGEFAGRWRVYEDKKELCKICNERDSVLLPICVIDGKEQMHPICQECRDKIPYKVIPVKTVLGEGYYFYNGEWHGSMKPVSISEVPTEGILTKLKDYLPPS